MYAWVPIVLSKNLPVDTKIVKSSQILLFGGYVKVKESFYTRVIIWVITILNHIDTTAILPRYEDSCLV